MFTGLIETTGEITQLRRLQQGMALGISPRMPGFTTVAGASVSVDGACLTVESVSGEALLFTAVGETLSRTTLQKARIGDSVNLERALPVCARLEGHFVLGHVDGIGQITFQRREGGSLLCGIRVPESTRRFMAEKGSVTIDGISLTIARYRDGEIEIALIPYTLEHTNMPRKRAGEEVNVECDVLARYVARCHEAAGERQPAEAHGAGGGPSIIDMLERSGF